jgi:hypothetical protein
MLRRYLIVNGFLTALLYGAVWAFAPSVPGLVRSLGATAKAVAIESPMLGPVIHRIVLISDQ